MDRRQRKTREAIFKAFISLLGKKDYNNITVGEIIEKADVGRATFYSHFETKDFLLKELSKDLFDHIFETEEGITSSHSHIFDCDSTDSVFLHLFSHLLKNDNNVLELLAGRNNELFLTYFKSNLTELIKSRLDEFKISKKKELPQDFLVNHIASTFVETLRWWVQNNTNLSPETITEYFLLTV